jgi:signal transduction histidine kinase
VALIFQPMREWLQRAVNRFMFGERDDPLAVLSSLSKRLEGASEPEAILPSIVETVGQALKLPYVAIEAYSGGAISVVAKYGEFHEDIERIPLIQQSEKVGQLVFARRSPHESFGETEYQLLRNIARQTGAAVHAARLTADLRRSRQQLVTTREEERRRLRRDLHDGLGPTLASLTLKIDTARNKLNSDPNAADRLLVETKDQIQDTLGDIRRLVYELRPPALDELGLVKAVTAFVDQQDQGITNVIRHSQASHALVRLFHQNGSLTIEIRDDGIGLPEPIPFGVGITSMRERAEELGGQLVIATQYPGTLLQAHLPCPKE